MDSRICQTSTASPAEPGGLPASLGIFLIDSARTLGHCGSGRLDSVSDLVIGRFSEWKEFESGNWKIGSCNSTRQALGDGEPWT
jgi:hypothetical protein